MNCYQVNYEHPKHECMTKMMLILELEWKHIAMNLWQGCHVFYASLLLYIDRPSVHISYQLN